MRKIFFEILLAIVALSSIITLLFAPPNNIIYVCVCCSIAVLALITELVLLRDVFVKEQPEK